ncbi:MAG: cytochrome c biogenesis protein CcdA [Hyphomicrobiales bacterium]|nr:cytochrome c biogenesis protein CcdA [Hyphomicrobiales bacterium]
MTLATLGLALLAGALSALSPCVLPLLPLVLGAAASEARGGPFALAAGVAVAFTAIGLFVATAGFAIGLEGEAFRAAAAILMIAVGVVLMAPGFQARIAAAGGPVTAWADERIGAIPSRGAIGQFGVGLLLGAAWSPCVGPTLGAASALAAQGSSLRRVALIMLAFGLGAAAPLIGVGLASRQALAHRRGRLIAGGKHAKTAIGVLMIALGFAIMSGVDKRIETALVDNSPQWLTDLTTRF